MTEFKGFAREYHNRMLAAYGFGLFALPRYREAASGPWRLIRHLPSVADGYVSAAAVEDERYVLYHRRTPWMSTGMMERESHAYHVHVARGTVVVAGLGLAMFVHAVAAKPDVDRVVVVEESEDVIELMRKASRWESWPGREKIVILQADALDPHLSPHVVEASWGQSPDYLFADIWERCADPKAAGETARMVRVLGAKAAGWWGQELAFADWWRARDGASLDPADHDAAASALATFVAESGVPVPLTPGYVAFCADVVAANPPTRQSGRSPWRWVWQRLMMTGR